MVDRYATKQFYNFGNYETSLKTYGNNQATDNPKFLWPKDSTRNAALGQDKETKVQRGYLRMITEAYGTENTALGNRRLHFQFNPDTLTRMVSARNDIQMWQNQDPYQFTQPIPGDANFSFDLMFNREAEVASASYRTGNGIAVSDKAANFTRKVNTGGGHPSRPKTTSFTDSPYDQAWVTDIGVLADLMVFDQIIGQGMNKDLIEKIAKKAQDVTAAYNLSKSGVTGTSDAADKEITFDLDKTKVSLGTNIGNSAFLIAQPIRVVFSSTFMVEGFVTSTSVVFNKFNPAMVPTQCLISVQMQAMYIGFANKDTYLTTLYKDFDASSAFTSTQTATTQTAENKALVDYGKKVTNPARGFVKSGTLDKSNLNPARIYTTDNDQVSRVTMRLLLSETTKDFAKSNYGSITAYLRVVVTYLGRTGGASVPPTVSYKTNDEVYRTTASKELNMSKAKDGVTDLEFEISNPTHTAGAVWDTASNARYRINAVIYYHIDGTQGASVDATQIATATEELTWNQTWYVAEHLKNSVVSTATIQGYIDAP